MKPKYEDFIYEFTLDPGDEDKIIVFCEVKALAYLLNEKILHINTRPYIENPYDDKNKWVLAKKETIVVFVNCNDVFAWGCADSEEIESSEQIYKDKVNWLSELLKYHLDDPKWGSVKWCCKKRNQRPQEPLVNRMKEENVWDKEMESLPNNYEDRELHDSFRRTFG